MYSITMKGMPSAVSSTRVDHHHVVVAEPSGVLRFAGEVTVGVAIDPLGMEQLDRHGPLQGFVITVQHHAKAAAAELFQDAISADRAEVARDSRWTHRDRRLSPRSRTIAGSRGLLQPLDQPRQARLVLEG